jgi:hypothetical protein
VLIKKFPQLRDAALSIAKPPIGTIIVSFGVWLVLLAAAFFVVAMLVGKDPNAGNQMPLPPKSRDLKKKK